MNEQVTSAAELDALPVGSVVLDAYAAACTRVRQQDMYDWVRASSAAPNGGKHFHPPYFPATVLYRPDQPQRVQPSAERVRRAIRSAVQAEHDGAGFGGRVVLNDWETACDDGSMADAVLALFAQQPTVAEVARKAWARGYSDAMGDYEHSDPLPPNPYGESEAHHG